MNILKVNDVLDLIDALVSASPMAKIPLYDRLQRLSVPYTVIKNVRLLRQLSLHAHLTGEDLKVVTETLKAIPSVYRFAILSRYYRDRVWEIESYVKDGSVTGQSRDNS